MKNNCKIFVEYFIKLPYLYHKANNKWTISQKNKHPKDLKR